MSRKTLNLTLLVAFAITLFATPGQAFATRTLGLSSGTFTFEVSAGKMVGGTVYVTNDGTEPIKVMVYASDQTVDSKGGITYSVPSRADLSALDQPSTWTQIKMPEDSKALGNIPYIELKPKDRVPVKFSFTVPSTVAPGDHNVMIFFEMFELPTGSDGAVSAVSGRLGTRITLRVAGEFVKKLEVRPFQVPPFVIGDKVPYSFTVRNVGNLDQRVGARMLLLDRSDSTVLQQTPINGRVVFAGTALEATGAALVERGAFGLHKVRIDVSPVDDEGKAISAGKDTITESRTVWMVPLWAVIALAVLVVLIIGRVIWMAALKSVRRTEARRSRRMRAREGVRARNADIGEDIDVHAE